MERTPASRNRSPFSGVELSRIAPGAGLRGTVNRPRLREKERGVHGARIDRPRRKIRHLGVGAIHVDEIRIDREHRGRLRFVGVQAGLQRHELGDLVGREPLPVVQRERKNALRHPRRGVRARVRDRERVVVVAVEIHDPFEADRCERCAQVLDERHERRNPDVRQAGESDVRIRQRVVDGRRNDGADRRRDPPGNFLRNQHVGQERPVRAVLLDGAGRAR